MCFYCEQPTEEGEDFASIHYKKYPAFETGPRFSCFINYYNKDYQLCDADGQVISFINNCPWCGRRLIGFESEHKPTYAIQITEWKDSTIYVDDTYFLPEYETLEDAKKEMILYGDQTENGCYCHLYEIRYLESYQLTPEWKKVNND